MEWFVPSIAATLAATVVLALVYAFLYLYERKPALGLWTLAWISCSFRYLVELGWYDRRAGAAYALGMQEFSLLMGLFLIWGCFAWKRRRLPAVWWIAAIACAGWGIVGFAFDWNRRWTSLPIFLFTGVALLMTGLSFWKRNDLGRSGRRILAIAFFLWALHKFDYPFLRAVDDFVPWGYLPSLVFSMVVAIGLLAVYLERERRFLLDSRARMQGLLDSTQETLILIDREGRVLACNETVARRLGMSAADLLDRNLYKILPEPISSARRKKAESVFLTGRAIEFEDERAGYQYWNYMSPALNPDGTIRAVAIFAEDITQRRHTEMERNRLFTYSMDLLCIGGFDGYLRELNPAWTRTLGWSETELKSRPWLDFVHPDDQAACVEADKRLTAGQAVLDFENRFQCKDGSWRWLSWNTIPLVDQGQVFAVARDISERKQADAKLRESEEKFSKMFRLNPEAMSISRLSDGMYLEVNDAFVQLSGYSRQEVIGHASTEIGIWVDPQDRNNMIKLLREQGRIHQFETKFYRKDRSVITAFFSAAPIEIRGEQYLLSIVMDITEQRKLKAERDRLFNYSIDPVCVAGFDGYFKQVNPAWTRSLGWSAEELVSRPWIEFVHPEDRPATEQAGKELTEGKSVTTFENRYRCKDGSWRWLSWNSLPLPQEHLIFAAVRDVTDQKTAEQSIRQRQAMLNSIYRAAPVGIGLVRSRVFDQVNDRICEMTGYGREELIGQSSRILYPTQEDFDFVGTEKYDQIRRQGWGAVETRWRRKDGTILDILLSSAPLDIRDLSVGAVFTAMDITQRKRSEKALKESEERFRRIVQSSPMGIHLYEVNADGQLILIDANAAADRFTGTRNADVLGLPAEKAFPGLAGTDIPTRYKQVALGLIPAFEMNDLEYNNSNIRGFFDVHAFQSGPGRMVAMFLEVTDRIQAKKDEQLNAQRTLALLHLNQMTEASLRELTDFALEEAVRLAQSRVGYLAFLNEEETVLSMYSWSRTAMAECSVADKPIHYPVEMTGLWGEAVRQRRAIITNDYPAPNPLKKGYPKGHVPIHRHMNVPVFAGDRIVLVAGVGNKELPYNETDVQQLTLLMEGMWRLIERNRVERRLSTLMSNLPGIAYRCLNNRDWTMEFISEGCMALTGYPPSDLVGNAELSYNDIIVPEDRDMVWETVQKALSEKRPYQITYRIRAADGAVKWVWEQGRGIYDDAGKLEALEGFVSDMTARILAEEQREDLLKALQVKTEELESIIYVSSHDLRSPLVNIQGFSGELEESCRQVQKLLAGNTVAESAEQRLIELVSQDIPAALEYITTSVSKLDALQKGLLKICRIGRESLDIRKVVMNDLIDGVLKSTHFQSTQCGAKITVESLPDCLADAAQLTQVFMNLIDNAIKYRSPDRSLVIRIYGRVEDVRSVYSVADNGIGIAPEHQKKVFEMFHQLDPVNGPGGEGLGLTIVKRILGRMDGQIRLESALGVGSVFSVVLPKA